MIVEVRWLFRDRAGRLDCAATCPHVIGADPQTE